MFALISLCNILSRSLALSPLDLWAILLFSPAVLLSPLLLPLSLSFPRPAHPTPVSVSHVRHYFAACSALLLCSVLHGVVVVVVNCLFLHRQPSWTRPLPVYVNFRQAGQKVARHIC